MLAALRLLDVAYAQTRSLAYGKQRMIEIALALATRPEVLLLDEPLEGLAPPIVQELLRIIGQTAASGEMAVILVEQHAHQIVPLTRHAPVLERGRVVFSGESEALRKDRSRLDQWLGVGSHQEPTEMGSKRIE